MRVSTDRIVMDIQEGKILPKREEAEPVSLLDLSAIYYIQGQ